MTSLMTVDPELLSWVFRQTKGTIVDFGIGKRDINAKFGGSTLEIAIGLLRHAEAVALKRGLDTTGPEWGPNVEGIISASGLDRDEWRA